MDFVTQYAVAVPVLAIVGLGGLLHVILWCTQHSREPPAVPSVIPFFGILWRMIQGRNYFYTDLRNQYEWPILTLRLPATRMYIVNSVELTTALQKQHKTIAFSPIEAIVAENMMGIRGQSLETIQRDVVADHGYLMTFLKFVRPGLAPGPGLNDMAATAVNTLMTTMNKLDRTSPTRIGLWSWVRHEVFMASSDAIYGPANPYRDPTVEAAWNTFERSIIKLMINVFPSITAREGLKAREVLINAFRKYLSEGGHHEASELMKCRYNHNKEFGVGDDDIARTETGGTFAAITNTTPASFWLVYHIFSDPDVLKDCRKDAESICTNNADGATTLDLSNAKESCPVIHSTLQEILRFHGVLLSSRKVLEDHLLDGQYFLRKGSTLLIPSRVQHTSRESWGDNVEEFDHRRFVRGKSGKGSNPAFRGFGGGTVLCPGRHFATTELVSFAAMMVVLFDVRPSDGAWKRPTTDDAPASAAVPAPDQDIEVDFVPRRDITMLRVVPPGSK